VCFGAGGFNHANHAPVLKRLAEGDAPRLSLEAICDLDRARAERFQQEFGFRQVYTDLARMMEETRPEVVYSLVQPTATAGVVSQVLPTGLPVFTEKPPGVTVEEANPLAELAETHGNLTYVAFNRRQMPVLRWLKQWLTDHAPVRYVRGEMLRNRRREPEFGIGTAIHALDALRFLCGDVAGVGVRAQPYGDGGCADYFVNPLRWRPDRGPAGGRGLRNAPRELPRLLRARRRCRCPRGWLLEPVVAAGACHARGRR